MEANSKDEFSVRTVTPISVQFTWNFQENFRFRLGAEKS